MAANDLKAFSVRITRTGKNVEENSDKLMRKVGLSIDQTVVFATPVDTGRARSNWQVTLDSPATDTLPEPASPGAGAQRAIDEGRAVINSYNGGVPIHITNNLPYIGRLNEGWSAQAGANFVQEAVGAGVAQIEGVEVVTGKGL